MKSLFIESSGEDEDYNSFRIHILLDLEINHQMHHLIRGAYVKKDLFFE